MFIKNLSKTVSIVINTTAGKVGIKPGEVVSIAYKILPPVSRSLTEVSEEEYITFLKKAKGIEEPTEKIETKPVQNTTKVVEKLDDLEKTEDEVVNDDPLGEIQDKSVMGFVNSLLNKDDVKPLQVNETNSMDEVERIEQQISDLKESWKTVTPRKKEKITKEKKELQKQLKKIKK